MRSEIPNYKSQQVNLELSIKELKRKINFYAYARLVVFAIAILLSYLFFNVGMLALIVIWVAMLAAFLMLVKKQVALQASLKFNETKLKLTLNEISMTGKNWSNIYNDGTRYQDADHYYSDDLDIFGAYSLFAYLNRSVTRKGEAILADWLKLAAPKDVVLKRQEAIAEITTHQEEIINFRTRLFGLKPDEVSMLEIFFKDFPPNKLSFVLSKKVRAAILLISIANPLLLLLAIVFGGVFWSVLALSLLAAATFYFFFKARIDTIHENIGNGVEVLKHYELNLRWIESVSWQSQLLQEMVGKIKSEKTLHSEIAALAKILDALNSRLNPIMGIILNLFVAWDLKCLRKLAHWEQRNKVSIVEGLNLISEFEVLISLATLKINHPAWALPVIYDTYHFYAEQMGHPLIEADISVVNDFSLPREPSIDIITGSNMAGKSTFLRTVGINMVLAFCGAHVCARKLETSLFTLVTYMRIKDSLATQTSTFKAEIERLKIILELSQRDPNSFVLIDEMLRGTNSRDKYLGSKVFIEKLVAQGSAGMLATHDLKISELEAEHPQQVRNFHFDILIRDEEMYFDYKIKSGECKTFNASVLLKAIGLEIDSDSSPG